MEKEGPVGAESMTQINKGGKLEDPPDSPRPPPPKSHDRAVTLYQPAVDSLIQRLGIAAHTSGFVTRFDKDVVTQLLSEAYVMLGEFDALTRAGRAEPAQPQFSAEEKKNYEKSYERMWSEIFRTREARDAAMHAGDAARDLIMLLQKDFNSGMTKVSPEVHEAFKRLKLGLGMEHK